MKKTFILVSILSILCSITAIFSANSTVLAEDNYLRVITEDTPFYQNQGDSEPLFFLPYTYYVRIIESGNDYCKVECKPSNDAPAIDGYVPTGLLFSDELTVTNPYLSISVRTATTALLFEDANLSTPMQYVFSERSMSYYGKFVNQAGFIVYYVSYNNRLGYVKESDIYPFSYPNHPNELTFIKPETPPTVEDPPSSPVTDGNSHLSIKIAIILCLLFSGIVALIFAIKKKPRESSAVTFYDENDYE